MMASPILKTNNSPSNRKLSHNLAINYISLKQFVNSDKNQCIKNISVDKSRAIKNDNFSIFIYL